MRSAILLSLALLPLWAVAQEPALKPSTQQELWLSFGLEGRAPKFLKDAMGAQYKRIRWNSELGYRSGDNFFSGKQLYGDLGLRYKVTEWLSLATEYRYSMRPQSSDRQRLSFQARAKHTIGRFDLGYRGAYQVTYLSRDRTRPLLRNRFSVDYQISNWKLDPEFSVEFYTGIDDPSGAYLLGTRYKLGTTWKPRRGYSISPAILYDREGRVKNPGNRVIWSIDLGIDLRKA